VGDSAWPDERQAQPLHESPFIDQGRLMLLLLLWRSIRHVLATTPVDCPRHLGSGPSLLAVLMVVAVIICGMVLFYQIPHFLRGSRSLHFFVIPSLVFRPFYFYEYIIVSDPCVGNQP
jgi:hypothetical protein